VNKKIIFLVAVVCAFVLVGAGVAIERYWSGKNKSEEASSTQTATATVTKTQSAAAKASATATSTGLKTYKNYTIKYLIEYPAEATVEDMSDPKADAIENSTCLKISTDNYYILIGKKPSESDEAGLCFRTGVGADWSNGPTDTLAAAGMEYTANGMHTEAASAGYYQDFFSISPVNGRVKIEYGTSVNEKYTSATKDQAKSQVHKIIASYSPAE